MHILRPEWSSFDSCLIAKATPVFTPEWCVESNVWAADTAKDNSFSDWRDCGELDGVSMGCISL